MGKWFVEFVAIANDITDEEVMRNIVYKISDTINEYLISNHDIDISLLCTAFDKIQNETNLGQCAKCGTWVSDYMKPDRVSCTSNGENIDGQWLCDACIPKDNPKSVWYEETKSI